MKKTGENTSAEEVSDKPAIRIDITRLRPIEVVFLSRYAADDPTGQFPAIEKCAEDLKRQLWGLPAAEPAFAREVCDSFAQSPFPADRDTLARHFIQPMTVADHDFGFGLWHQLVRDQHPKVRSEAYSKVRLSLNGEDTHGNKRPVEETLAELGLTLDDAHELTHAFIDAQYHDNLHVIGKTAMAAHLEEETQSFQSYATLD